MDPLLLLLATFVLHGVHGNKVTQTPQQLLKTPESPLDITCTHNDINLIYMNWYRQLPRRGIELIAYLTTNSKPTFEKDFDPNRYEITYTKENNVFMGSFNIKSLEPADSGTFFCAATNTVTKHRLPVKQKHGAESQSAVKVSQSPSMMILRAGQAADMNCTQSASNPNMYWYRQKTSGPLRFLFYTVNSDKLTEKGDGISDWLSVSRESVQKTALKITRAQPADTAVYYCASSPQYATLYVPLSEYSARRD